MAGGGGGTPPDVFPGDGSQGWAFPGATADARSGIGVLSLPLRNNSNANIFTGANPFAYDATGGPGGIPCAKVDYPASPPPGGNDQGADCNVQNLPNMQFGCLRWAFLKTSFSNNFWKLMRLSASGTFIFTPGLNDNANNVIIHSDSWDVGSPTDTGYAPPNGTWICLRYWWDFRVASNTVQRMYANNAMIGEEISNFTGATPNPATTFINFLQVDGTVNKPFSSGTEAFSQLGIATFLLDNLPGF